MATASETLTTKPAPLETPHLGNKVTLFVDANMLAAADILARRSSLSFPVWLIRLAEREIERDANRKPARAKRKISSDLHRTKISPELEQRIRKQLDDGLRVSQIAAAAGISNSTISRIGAKAEAQTEVEESDEGAQP